ncbi:adenosylcobinamide-phosphate synthase CbiB [Tropicimonas isoalkanivorans]|uniref:Cobalamin biosynthesis protein CobD n=1 Tax=Tropicimonas isoalkanivorans TaxID=441112 RepID=A0A1I1PAB7_9RHOB|nr:adenosylcobinamide-phosphate synthase CbiB [Tropicimonas isoalkanivorans]SFD06685.1 adenosylcobinamide-phosphate synthase [Tropicimonas isoalkanivorans]
MIGTETMLLGALLLDAALGEPRWLWSRLPHPAVLMGRCVGWLDAHTNGGDHRRLKGCAALFVLVIGAWGLGSLLEEISPGGLIDTLLAAVLIAQRSLVEHVSAVASALRQGLPEGRKAVGMIVGRDTAEMDEAAVARAAIESAAENFSDGVVAPALAFLVAGLPGILVYKVVNTADSMIGHRTPRHEAFGWAAARFDDLLNLLPARLAAALILLGHGRLTGWGLVARDAGLHRSPNAGWPEAAMARCLGVALSGPRSYDGEMRDFPFINPEGNRSAGAGDIDRASRALWRSWLALLLGVAVLALI